MIHNDLILVEEVLKQDKDARFPSHSDSSHFEIFVTEQILKNYELTDDDIEAGITGGGNDGGIDAIFSFVNGQLLFEDTDLTAYKKTVTIDVHLIQAKRTKGFEGSAIDKVSPTMEHILDLEKDLTSSKEFYDIKLIQAAEYFRKAYKQLASKFPIVNLFISYATLGDTEQIHKNVRRKADELSMRVHKFLPCKPSFNFYGVKELHEMARTHPINTLKVDLFDHISGSNAYLCLINLKDYYTFITDENNHLRKHIFETNVRDYQGEKVVVNQGIKKTLESNSEEDFWWLNNGVTIIAAQASISSKTITLEDPQIVNGLQTSTEIFEYFKESPKVPEMRSVLVKIIETTSSDSQEKIIRATNSQTTVPLASLKATDKIQRDIEEYFRRHDLYYDRRKNFYKNQNVQRDKIISIPYLSQAIMTIVLQEPNEARARPSSILKKDADYKKIFNLAYPLELYLNCIKIMIIADHHIKSDKTVAKTEEKSNFKFHFALYLFLSLVKYKSNKREIVIENAINLNPESIDPIFLDQKWQELIALLQKFQHTNKKTNYDATAKSKEFVEKLLQKFPEKREGKGRRNSLTANNSPQNNESLEI